MGVARPERARAGDDQHGDRGGERRGRRRCPASQPTASVPTAMRDARPARTPPEIRSASRCTGALPVCASSTSRAIWASWVSAPTRVARDDQAAAGVDGRAGHRGRRARPRPGTDSPVSMRRVDGRDCPRRRRRRSRSSRRAGRRTGRRRASCGRWDADARVPSRRTGDVLGAQRQQGPQRRARHAAWPAPPAGGRAEHQRGHPGRDFRCSGLALARREERARASSRPPEVASAGGGTPAEISGVHGGRAVPGTGQRGAVERPRPPHRDRGRQRQADATASPGNCHAGTIPSATTGTARASDDRQPRAQGFAGGVARPKPGVTGGLRPGG